MPTKVEVLFFEGCPHHREAVDLAREVVAEIAPDLQVEEVEVLDNEQAEELRFLGSPTIRVNGADIEPDAASRKQYALACRMYGGSGVPPRELLEGALERSTR